MQDIVIFGIGGMAKETVCVINEINKVNPAFRLIGFVVDDEYYSDDMICMEMPVYRRSWLVENRNKYKCVCCIGYPKDRRKTMLSLEEQGVSFQTLVHPSAWLADENCLGEGCIIGANCFVSVDCHLGKGVFMNGPVAVIGHDCVLEDYVTCFPKSQISGGCFVGEAALIGSMAYIHEKRRIGSGAVVAPGSVVIRNVKDETHVMGNPAKKIEI